MSFKTNSFGRLVKKITSGQSIRYIISSAAAFAIDYSVLLLLERLLSGFALAMELAAVISFAISSQVNFHINRLWVFKSNKSVFAEMGGYYGLAVFSFSVKTFVLLELFVRALKLPTWLAKPIAEAVMFVVNYLVQKKLIFKKREKMQ